MCELKQFEHLKMDGYHQLILKNELAQWHSHYLPIDIEGKTVLDVGAGNGETPQLFFNHKARHVIAIDSEAELLAENFKGDPHAVIVPKDASIVVIPWAVDLIKSDCEGGEKNMLVEIHFPWKLKILHRFQIPDHGAIVRLEEDWGGFLRKLVRKLSVKVLSPIARRTW